MLKTSLSIFLTSSKTYNTIPWDLYRRECCLRWNLYIDAQLLESWGLYKRKNEMEPGTWARGGRGPSQGQPLALPGAALIWSCYLEATSALQKSLGFDGWALIIWGEVLCSPDSQYRRACSHCLRQHRQAPFLPRSLFLSYFFLVSLSCSLKVVVIKKVEPWGSWNN